MNELSPILMSSAGKKIITKVITFHWLRINIGKTNFAELMMVNYMKVKLTERRIGRIVVRVLNSFFRECAIITFCVVCVNFAHYHQAKDVFVFIFFSRLITRRETEFSGSHAKHYWHTAESFYSPRNFKTLQLYN